MTLCKSIKLVSVLNIVSCSGPIDPNPSMYLGMEMVVLLPDVLTNVDLPIADHYDLSITLKRPC